MESAASSVGKPLREIRKISIGPSSAGSLIATHGEPLQGRALLVSCPKLSILTATLTANLQTRCNGCGQFACGAGRKPPANTRALRPERLPLYTRRPFPAMVLSRQTLPSITDRKEHGQTLQPTDAEGKEGDRGGPGPRRPVQGDREPDRPPAVDRLPRGAREQVTRASSRSCASAGPDCSGPECPFP